MGHPARGGRGEVQGEIPSLGMANHAVKRLAIRTQRRFDKGGVVLELAKSGKEIRLDDGGVILLKLKIRVIGENGGKAHRRKLCSTAR